MTRLMMSKKTIHRKSIKIYKEYNPMSLSVKSRNGQMEYDKDCKTSEELNDDQIIAAVLENKGVETVNDDSRTPSSDFTHRR